VGNYTQTSHLLVRNPLDESREGEKKDTSQHEEDEYSCVFPLFILNPPSVENRRVEISRISRIPDNPSDAMVVQSTPTQPTRGRGEDKVLSLPG